MTAKLTLYGEELPITKGPIPIIDRIRVGTKVTMEQYHRASNGLDLVIDDDSRKFELSAKGAYSVDQARLGGLIDVDFDFSGEELTNESVKSHEAAEF